MNTETQRWIEAAKVLAMDPTAKVRCPRNNDSDLEVEDVVINETHLERHLRCPKCGAYNAILLPKKGGGSR